MVSGCRGWSCSKVKSKNADLHFVLILGSLNHIKEQMLRDSAHIDTYDVQPWQMIPAAWSQAMATTHTCPAEDLPTVCRLGSWDVLACLGLSCTLSPL
jgi:hypothetical protein